MKEKWSYAVVVLAAIGLALFIYFNSFRLRERKINLEKNYTRTIAITTGCTKNIRSSLDHLDYQFSYKGQLYKGTQQFDSKRHDDICSGVKFVAYFDSTQPTNNKIFLDSMIIYRNP